MKIDINKIKEAPSYYDTNTFCVHNSQVNDEFIHWIDFHKFEAWSDKNQQYLNFKFTENIDLTICFNSPFEYTYVDGFSPNLNKHLHLGHLSNFILAKSFQSLGIGKKYIANLGDTLEGRISKEEALKAFTDLCLEYDYCIDTIYLASHMITNKGLSDGEGDYAGTKIFNIDGNKIVGIKSDGSTTYFMQDVALAEKLNATTLYMTGAEQSNHFKALNYLFPQTRHIPLGLVTLNSSKMASRTGNVIYISEVFDLLKDKFGDNKNLIWNVLCGYILKSNPSSSKNISYNDLDNVKTSFGLYLSYTLAKLNSAGLSFSSKESFNHVKVQFAFLKAQYLLEPNILLKELVNVAKEIAGLYEKYRINGHSENHHHFITLAEDLLTGMLKLGMKDVFKV